MATLIDYILIFLDLKESCQCTMHEHVQMLSDFEVSKCDQSRWPSKCGGFHGHHGMRKESIVLSFQNLIKITQIDKFGNPKNTILQNFVKKEPIYDICSFGTLSKR